MKKGTVPAVPFFVTRFISCMKKRNYNIGHKGEQSMEFDLNKKYCYYFNELCKIPHGSRNEKGVSDYIVSIAKSFGYSVKQDHVWNVFVDIPASEGAEKAKPLILQAHMDMVTDKLIDSNHDFTKDPLDLYVEDGWLHARGTTLGADDGMGVAYMLAIMDQAKELKHPALELIFTVMEEIGLLGSMEIKAEDIHAKQLISLDGGGEVKTTVTSAGGMDVHLNKDYTLEQADANTYKFSIKGLKGGHSGGSIHLERYNANNLAARILKEVNAFTIVRWHGGMKNNAITRENEIVLTSNASFEELNKKIRFIEEKIKKELEPSEPDFYIEFQQIDSVNKQMEKSISDSILTYLWLMPSGFQHRHMAIEGLTAASLNLGVVDIEDGKFHGLILMRSCFDTMLEDQLNKLKELGKLLNIHVEMGDHYTGWAYEEKSELRKTYGDVCKKHGRELIAQASHGGLECGVFKGLEPEMDIITMGAITEDIHSPQERLNLQSFDDTWELLKEIVEQCANVETNC